MSRPAIDFNDLPEDDVARREILEERTTPDPNRPELPGEYEKRLAAVEERTAQAYVDCEESVYRIKQLTEGVKT